MDRTRLELAIGYSHVDSTYHAGLPNLDTFAPALQCSHGQNAMLSTFELSNPWGGEIRPRTQSDKGLAVLSQYTPPQIIRIAPADPIPFLCSDFPPNRQRPIRRPNYLSVGSVGVEPTTNVPPTKLKPFGVRPACGASVNYLQSTSNRASQVQYQTYTWWFAALPIELTPRSTPPR